MGKLAGFCVSGVFFAGLVVVSAQEDPPPRVRQICDPTAPEMAEVCVPDTLEVIFGTDKNSTHSVFQYTTLPTEPVDVTIVTDTKSEHVQGWSYGVAHDMDYLTVLEATVAGTDAEGAPTAGFEATYIDVEKCEDAKCTNRTKGSGFISSVVLSLKTPVELTPRQRNSMCKARYTIDRDAGVAGTYLEITDLLALHGTPPTGMGLTVNGRLKIWTNATNGWIKRYSAEATFRRGDANDDGKVDIADPVWLINELVRQGPAAKCRDAADANDDGQVDLSDAMYLIAWQFLGQSAPPSPGPFECGVDSIEDTLSCDQGSTELCP